VPKAVTFREKWHWFCLYGALSAKFGDISRKVALVLSLSFTAIL
jgi:hypothetical protein